MASLHERLSTAADERLKQQRAHVRFRELKISEQELELEEDIGELLHDSAVSDFAFRW